MKRENKVKELSAIKIGWIIAIVSGIWWSFLFAAFSTSPLINISTTKALIYGFLFGVIGFWLSVAVILGNNDNNPNDGTHMGDAL